MSLEVINSLKAAISKEESDLSDVLQRLDEIDMTLELLQHSLIGKTVAKLKNDPTVGSRAKELVKKWKQLVATNTCEDTRNKNNKHDNSSKNSKNSSTAQRQTASDDQRRKSLGSSTNCKDEEPNAEGEWAHLPPMRQNICKKIFENLLLCKEAMVADGINSEAIDHLLGPRAVEIEAAMAFKFLQKKDYADKARSLAFNLKRNIPLGQQVVLGHMGADELVTMTPEQLASAETVQQRAQEAKKLIESKRLDWDQANEAKINEMCGIKGDLLKASLFTCGRCKSTKTTSTQKQTRSADEPMTVFVLCLSCGKRWKC